MARQHWITRLIVIMLSAMMLISGSGLSVLAESVPAADADKAPAEQTVVQDEDAQAADQDSEEADVNDEDEATGTEEEAAEEDAAEDAGDAEDLSDETADVEAAADWEATLPEELSEDVRKAVVQVAGSQAGYKESADNFIETEDGDIKSYSRYSAFMEEEYADPWDADFVMFTLHYAGAFDIDYPSIPLDTDSGRWFKALRASKLTREIGTDEDGNEQKPEAGDIIFTGSAADFTDTKAAVMVKDAGDELVVIGVKTEDGRDMVAKFTVKAADVAGFVSLEDIAADMGAEGEEKAAGFGAVAEDIEKAAGEAAEKTEEGLAEEDENTDADNEDADTEDDKDEEEAAKDADTQEEEPKAAHGLVLAEQSLDAKLVSAPGVGGKLRSLFSSEKGTEITVSGIMPKGAIVEAYPVDVEIEGQNVLTAYDITIYAPVYDENGEPTGETETWQPIEALSVSIKDDKIADAGDVTIYHMEDKSANAECIAQATVSDDAEVAFDAGEFSVYAVVKTVIETTISTPTGKDYKITVTYDSESGLPTEKDGAALDVEVKDPEDYQKKVQKATGNENMSLLKAFDISIVDSEGTKYQPTKSVLVSIEIKGKEGFTYPQVVHIPDGLFASPEAITPEADGNTLTFRTDGFSIYVIGEDDTSKHVNYRFWLDENDINNSDPLSPTPYRIISLKNNEQLLAPADPTVETRGAFQGWYTKRSGSEARFICSDEIASIAEGATADINVDIYAKFDGAQYANFQSLYIDMNRTVFHTEKLTMESDGTYSLDLSTVPTYGAPVGYKFLGWTTTQPTDPLGYGEDIPKGSYYAPTDTVTGLSGNTTFYPVVKELYTVSLDGNGGTINGLPVYKIQATKDDTWEAILPDITTASRPGYTRNNGWWKGADDSAEAITLSGDVSLAGDATYYVHWNSSTTKVTVKYWKQAVNENDPYSFIDEDIFTLDTGTTVELGKATSSTNVSRTDVLFYNPGSYDPDSASTPDSALDILNVITRIKANAAGADKSKLGNASSGDYVTDTDLQYFHVDSISGADADGNRHTSSPTDPYGRTFTIAEDGSTVINVWINRTTYHIRFSFLAYRTLLDCFINDGRLRSKAVEKYYPSKTGYYDIKLGEEFSGNKSWPDLTADELLASITGGRAGYKVVGMGFKTGSDQYPDAVSQVFPMPLAYVTSELLSYDTDGDKNIELWGSYNNINFRGGIRNATLHEYKEQANGGYGTPHDINFSYAIGERQADAQAVTTAQYPGYELNVTETLINHNNNTNVVYSKTDNHDGTATLVFNRGYTETYPNRKYEAAVYYDLSKYTINLQYGNNILASDTQIKYTQNIKSYLKNSTTPVVMDGKSVKDVFDDPTEAAGVPDYLVFDGWYTDQEFTSTYALKDYNTMPYHNVVLYAKFSPKAVTVNIDNGIKDGDQKIENPALNMSGSEMGGSVRYLKYQYENGTTIPHKANEHTIAEFLPTYWVNPVWENHVFTGWQWRERDASTGNWGNWQNLVDINTAVNHDIELKANWQDMTRHNVHYIENGKEVYLDPESYVKGKTVVVKGTTTERYDKENKKTYVFRYWKDSDNNHYLPGQEIEMGDEDITLTAVFEEGGISSGSGKATYTFKTPDGNGGWETYYEEIVYRGERLSSPPETPTSGTKEFEGWYLDAGLTERFTGFGETISAPMDTTLYASFNKPYRVTYRGFQDNGDGELITVQTYSHNGTENLNTMGVGKYYTYQNGSVLYKLIGWSEDKQNPGTIPANYYSGYTDKLVKSDMTLYPVLEDGFWLKFYQDENMVTIPDVYYAKSQSLNFTWPDPDDVKRTDYTFTGKWYIKKSTAPDNPTLNPNDNPEYFEEFNWNQTGDDLGADTTIYAGWKPNDNVTSQYTVVWWVEKADSNGDLTDKSNYVYSNSVTVPNAVLGDEISNTVSVTTTGTNRTSGYQTLTATATDLHHVDQVYGLNENRVLSYFGNYFQINNSLTDASTIVKRDGSATLNIYVQRVRYTLQFNVRVGNNNIGAITYNNQNYNTQWSETGWFQMPLAGKWPVDNGDGKTVPKLKMNTGYRYGGWDYTNASSVSDPTSVPDLVASEWLSPIQPGTTIIFNLKGNGGNTQTTILYRFLNNVELDDTVTANYEETTFDGRRFDQTLNSTGNFGAKDIIGYDHHSDIGTNPQPASGNQPRTYTFYYLRQTYKIHLYDANGAEIAQSPITMMVGESLENKIDDPAGYNISTPAGKEFAGWSRSADALVNVYDKNDADATMPLYDIHYYLHWKDKQVTVTVKKHDGVTSQEYGPLVYGSKLNEFGLQSEDIDGHMFMGWKNAETGETISLTTKITDDIIIEGVYLDLRARKLYYSLNGGTLKEGQSDPIDGTELDGDLYKDTDNYMAGASVPVKNISAEKINTPEGTVDFAYWNTESNGTGDIYYPNDAFEIPSGSDVTLYAIYAPIMETTLVYDYAAGESYTGKPEDVSVKFWDYRDSTKPSWYLKVNDPYKIGYKQAGDSQTGNGIEEIMYSGKQVQNSRTGYTFRGWDKSDSLSDSAIPSYQSGDNIRITSYDPDTGAYQETQKLYGYWKKDTINFEAYTYETDIADAEKIYEGTWWQNSVETMTGATLGKPYDSTTVAGSKERTKAATWTGDDNSGSVPSGYVFACAKLNDTVLKGLRYQEMSDGYAWQYTTDGTNWNNLVTEGDNSETISIYYCIEKKALEVTNKIEGKYADMNKKFDIKITLTKADATETIKTSELQTLSTPEGNSFTLTDDEKSAWMEVSLGDGENIEIGEIPTGWNYTIEENEHAGYTLYFDNTPAVEDSKSGTLSADTTVAVKNVFDDGKVVPTGIEGSNSILIPIFVGMVLALGMVVSIRRKRHLGIRR